MEQFSNEMEIVLLNNTKSMKELLILYEQDKTV